MTLPEVITAIEAKHPDVTRTEFRGETTLSIQREQILDVAALAKELGFDTLVDLSSVDHFGQEPRFEMVYELYSLSDNHHLRLKYPVSEDDAEVPSVINIWRGADWHEREVWDMMGIRFRGHPDLRRILMWEGYPYFPLRKDFPLAGRPSEVPDVAFTRVAPLEGGPFVTTAGGASVKEREPRSRSME